MSWLRHDDDMLDHPKWIRALRDGGADALLIWWRLCAWSSRRLTDGVIPVDMIGEVGRIERSKNKLRALQALVDSGLCSRRADGALVIEGYLERNPSKADVLAQRASGTERKQKHRVRVSASREAARPAPDVPRDASTTRPDPVPIPSPSLSDESESARALDGADLPQVPGLTLVGAPPEPHPGTLKPSQRDQADAVPPSGPPGLRYRFRPDWDPSPAHRARGHEYGLTDEEMLQRAEDCRLKPIKHGFQDEDEHFFRELLWMKRDREKRVFKTQGEREAFELPGRERRAR